MERGARDVGVGEGEVGRRLPAALLETERDGMPSLSGRGAVGDREQQQCGGVGLSVTEFAVQASGDQLQSLVQSYDPSMPCPEVA